MGRTSGGSSGGGGGPSYQQGTGEPTTVTPASVGQLYINTGNGGLYIAPSTTEGDWLVVGGTTSVAVQTGAQGVSGVDGTAQYTIAAGANDAFHVSPGNTVLMAGGAEAFGTDGTSLYDFLPKSTGQIASISTQSVSSGSAFTPNAHADVELCFQVTHAGTLTMTMGPSTGSENTIFSSVTVILDEFFTKRIPANWKVIITLASSATIGSITKQVI